MVAFHSIKIGAAKALTYSYHMLAVACGQGAWLAATPDRPPLVLLPQQKASQF